MSDGTGLVGFSLGYPRAFSSSPPADILFDSSADMMLAAVSVVWSCLIEGIAALVYCYSIRMMLKGVSPIEKVDFIVSTASGSMHVHEERRSMTHTSALQQEVVVMMASSSFFYFQL